MIRPGIWFAIAVVALCGCDKTDDPVHTGQNYVDQARAAAGVDFDQKVDMAVNLIKAGQLADAQKLLDDISSHQASLSDATKAKLADAKSQLAKAQGR